MPARWYNSGAVPRPSLFERSAAWFGVAGFATSFFLFAPAAICAEEKNGSPRTEDILKKAIERAKWSEERKFEAKYTYTRSEEHTSELQSRGHLVCRLLL